MEKLPDLASLTSDQKDQLILTLFSFIQELRDEISLLKKENAELRRENAELKLEIIKLKSQLNRNSQNSSQPPSSDGFKRPKH